MEEKFCVVLDNGASYSDWSVYCCVMITKEGYERLDSLDADFDKYCDVLKDNKPLNKWGHRSGLDDDEKIDAYGNFLKEKGIDAEIVRFDGYHSIGW